MSKFPPSNIYAFRAQTTTSTFISHTTRHQALPLAVRRSADAGFLRPLPASPTFDPQLCIGAAKTCPSCGPSIRCTTHRPTLQPYNHTWCVCAAPRPRVTIGTSLRKRTHTNHDALPRSGGRALTVCYLALVDACALPCAKQVSICRGRGTHNRLGHASSVRCHPTRNAGAARPPTRPSHPFGPPTTPSHCARAKPIRVRACPSAPHLHQHPPKEPIASYSVNTLNPHIEHAHPLSHSTWLVRLSRGICTLPRARKRSPCTVSTRESRGRAQRIVGEPLVAIAHGICITKHVLRNDNNRCASCATDAKARVVCGIVQAESER